MDSNTAGQGGTNIVTSIVNGLKEVIVGVNQTLGVQEEHELVMEVM